MTILSHVSVDFTDKHHNILFSVPAHLIDCVLTAPDEIQQDPIFDLLLADGSLEAVRSVARKKALENEPASEVTAEGKKPKTTDDPASEVTPDSKEPKSTDDLSAEVTSVGKKPKAAKAPATGKAEGTP